MTTLFFIRKLDIALRNLYNHCEIGNNLFLVKEILDMTPPKAIPKPSLQRMPIYYRILKDALEQHEEFISSAELGRRAKVSPQNVRKDLAFLPEQGQAGIGYSILSLANCLEDTLGLLKSKDAVIVGVGNLGKALMLYQGFKKSGIQIVVAFDNDPKKMGEKIGKIPIMPIEKISNLVRRMNLKIGIITTPADTAQETADLLVEGGCKAIWNFTPTMLKVPDDVMVRNEDLSVGIMVLSHYVESMKVINETFE